jgi:hypothetical protein
MLVRIVTSALVVLAVIATASLGSAQAATVTYMSTDVPKQIDDGLTASSTLFGPENLPPVLDLEIVGVQVAATMAGGSHRDKVLFLTAPNSFGAALAGGNGGCTSLGFNATFDDQAASEFNDTSDCTATATRRPTNGNISSLFAGDEFSSPGIGGSWQLSFQDFGNGAFLAPPARLNAWGLRATFAAMKCSVGGKKQELKKKLEVEVKCDADTNVKTSGDAKGRTLKAHAGKDTLKVALKGGALRRLDGGGKAKIKLEAANELGDVFTKKVKVKVTD